MSLSFITTEITSSSHLFAFTSPSPLYGTYEHSSFMVDSLLTDNALKRSLVAGPCLSLSLTLLDRERSSSFLGATRGQLKSKIIKIDGKKEEKWDARAGGGGKLRSGFRPSSPLASNVCCRSTVTQE